MGLKLNGIDRRLYGYNIFIDLLRSNLNTFLLIFFSWVSNYTRTFIGTLKGFLKLILPEYSLFNEHVISFVLNLVGGKPYPDMKNFQQPIASLSNFISAVSLASNSEGLYHIVIIVSEYGSILIILGYTSKLLVFVFSHFTIASYEEGFLNIIFC